MKRKILHLFFSAMLFFLAACNFGNNGDGTGKNNNVVISDSLVQLTLPEEQKSVSYYDNSPDKKGEFCTQFGLHHKDSCQLDLTVNHALLANLLRQNSGPVTVKLIPVTNKPEQQKVIEFAKNTPLQFSIEKFDQIKDQKYSLNFAIPQNDIGATVKFKVEVTASGVTVAQKYSNISLDIATKSINDIKFDAGKVYTKGDTGSVTFYVHDNNSDDKFDLQASNQIFATTSGLSNIKGSCTINMGGSYDSSCTISNAFTVASYADDEIGGQKVNFRLYAIDPDAADANYGSVKISEKIQVPVQDKPKPILPQLAISPTANTITKVQAVNLEVSFSDKSPEFADAVTVHLVPGAVVWKRLKHKLKMGDDINKYINIEPQTIDLHNKAEKGTFVVSIKPEVTDEDMRTIFNNFNIYADATDTSKGKAIQSDVANIKNGGGYIDHKWLEMKDKDGNVVPSMSFVNGKDAQVFHLKAYKIDDIKAVDLYVAKNGSIEPLDDGFDTEEVIETDGTITFTIKADGATPTDQDHKDTLIALIGDEEVPINSGVTITVTDPKFAYHISPEIRPVLADFPEPYYIEIDNVAASSHKNVNANADNILNLYADQPETDGCKNLVVRPVQVPTSGEPIVGDVCSLSSSTHKADNPCSCVLTGGAKVNGYCVFKIEPGAPYGTANQSCNITLKLNGVNASGSHKVISTNGFDAITVSANTSSPSFPNGHRIEMCASDTGNYANCPLNYDNWVTRFNRINLDNKSLFNKSALFSMSASFFDAGSEGGNKFVLKNYPGRNLGRVLGFENEQAVLPKTNFIMGWNDKSPRWDNNRCLTGDFETSNLGCDNRGDSAFSVYGKTYVEPGAIIVKASEVTIDGSKSILNIPSRWETMGEAYKQNARYHNIEAQGGSSVMFNLHP